MNESASIKQKAASSIKWSAMMEIVSRTASPIVFVILARLLTPADFGVLATAMIVVSFAQMFWDAGLSKALIQTNEIPEDVAHVVFWSNAVLGLAIYALLFATTPWIVIFFKIPGSGLVLRVLGLLIVIASFSSVQQALFVREMDFRRLFWIRLFTVFLPGVFSIPLAYFGYGVWALVAGTLAGQLLNLFMLWRLSPWRPKIQFEKAVFFRIFGFGIWVLGESFCNWFIMWGDGLIVGKFLGPHDLGIYRTGWMLVCIIFGLVLNPFLPVLYPSFSRLQYDKIAFKEYFHKVNRVISALSLPMGVGLLLIGQELTAVLFGNKWQGIEIVLGFLGLKEGLNWLVGINAEVYRAMGRPDINAKLAFIQIFYFIPVFLIAAQSGLETFVYARMGVAIITIPLHVYLCRKMLGVSPFYLWFDTKTFILSTAVMGIVVFSTKGILTSMPVVTPKILTLIIIIIAGALSYVLALWVLDRKFVINTTQMIRRVI